MAGRISMGARREVLSAVAERYRWAGRREKGRILDELCATMGWHRKHAVRALGRHETGKPAGAEERTSGRGKYDATIKDAVTALWEASDRVCGKRLVVMIPTLVPALERHGRLKLDAGDRERVLAISAATIDRTYCRICKCYRTGSEGTLSFGVKACSRRGPVGEAAPKGPTPSFVQHDVPTQRGIIVLAKRWTKDGRKLSGKMRPRVGRMGSIR